MFKLVILYSFFQFTIIFSQKDTIFLNKFIDDWHLAASNADFNSYFNKMAENTIFIGTAPNERWTKSEFISFAKPYFDKGKAWDFKAKNRNWSFSTDNKTAWFDEDLTTWMEDCRGTGVVQFLNDEWKIVLYDLHVVIENEKIQEFIKLRKSEVQNKK